MYTKIGKIMADTRWTEIIQFEKIKGQISTKIFEFLINTEIDSLEILVICITYSRNLIKIKLHIFWKMFHLKF